MTRAAAVLAAALLTTGCLAPAPRLVVDGPHGDVFADDAALADDVALDLARLVPQIRALLPGTRDAAPDVWIQDELSLFVGFPVDETVGGFAVTTDTWLHWWTGDRIHVATTSPERLRVFLAHELVHCVVDDVWHALPPAVEEGLCDAVAVRLEPLHGPAHRGVLLLAAGLAVGHLPLVVEYDRPQRATPRRLALEPRAVAFDPAALLAGGRSTVKGTSGVDGMKRRGLGYVVVSRIVDVGGFEALRGLVVEAREAGRERVAPRVLLDAARLGEAADWRAAIDRQVGPGELAAIAREIGEELGRRTAPIAALDHPDSSPPRLTVDADVRLVYGRGRSTVEIPLVDEAFVRGLVEAWPSPASATARPSSLPRNVAP